MDDEAGGQQTRYLHLLTMDELRELRPVLEILQERREEVLTRWHEAYIEHFGEARTLAAPDFRAIYGRDLDSVVENLLREDLVGFEAEVRSAGYALLERGVPFAEVVASLHLFEESTTEQFHRRLRVMVKGPTIYLTFDKLSHCRMILLADAYFTASRAETQVRLRRQDRELASGLSPSGRYGLVGRSVAMQRVYAGMTAAAGGQGAVLIAGESGTGKELVARGIHESAGDARPFIAVNCPALPRELIESELFGHRKGAYTGAIGESPGLVRAANGGTLFLDEITEMAIETQAKLLRTIEERKVRPVGMAHEVPVQVRFIAATNRDPERAIDEGYLRRDLYYRLNVHRIDAPPLARRREDIPDLVAHFIQVFAARGLGRARAIEDDALAALAANGFPGNVRELKNAIESALMVATGPRITVGDLPSYLAGPARGPVAPVAEVVPTIEEAECDLIVRALRATGGNKLRAARMLGISRHRLYDRMRRFSLG